MAMRRLYYILLAVVCTCVNAEAQTHVLQYGVRGGMAFGVGNTGSETRCTIGGIGFADVGYTFYQPMSWLDIGVHTGLSFGYRLLPMSYPLREQFTNRDYLGNEMQYSVSGKASARQHDVSCEIPVMFALRSDGLVFNVGAKLRPSIWQQNNQTLSDVVIDAYYPLTDVHIINEVITGVLPPDMQQQTAHATMASLAVLADMELGCEWQVSKTSALGFLFFVDCTLWDTRSAATTLPVVTVSNISNPQQPVPAVSVNNTVASQLGCLHPIECGIKFYGTFFKIGHKHWHKRWR